MKSNRTIETFFQRAIFRYAGIVFVLLVAILLTASFLLAREQAASDLRESAKATALAFKDRIVDGDIRAVEAQMKDVLLLKDGEVAKILKTNHSPVYLPIGAKVSVVQCPEIGVPCFDGYFGKARIEVPVSMDSGNKEPFRFLFLSRSVAINWSFLITVFVVFSLGYAALIVVFMRVSKIASLRLGSEIGNWSARIRENPKDASPRQKVPFNELAPLKEALEGLNKQIEDFEKTATDKAKLLLLRGIAHDLLTPVSQLQLNLATLQTRLNSSEHGDLLSDIADSLRRVAGVASQVKSLKTSKNDEISDFIKEATHEVKSLSESELVLARNISLEFETTHSSMMSPFSQTDISRILANLIHNAVDASTDGSVIQVSVRSDSNHGILTVKDSGKGIPKSAQSKVFEPEFTLKPGTGTGLGLAVVKYICDSKSAKIALSSELNRGTTVSIEFPVVRGAHV